MVPQHSAFDLVLHSNWNWYVNNKKIKYKNRDIFEDSFSMHDNLAIESCPFCQTPMRRTWYSTVNKGDDNYDNGKFILKFCIKCAYWKFSGSDYSEACMDSPTNIIASSLAAKFDRNPPAGCSAELAQFIVRNPNYLNEINPIRLESLVADVFKQNHRLCEVRHVGRPGDLGVDVLFVDSEETKWLIQVKRREKPNKPEGFSTLQSILGTLILNDSSHGIIVSTSNSFSRPLEKQRGIAQAKGYTIKLIDKSLLTQMVGSIVPNTPWKDFFINSSVSDYLKPLYQKFLSIKLDKYRSQKIEQGKQTSFLF